MKKLKSLFLGTFLAIASFVSAQSFSLPELIDLAGKDQDYFNAAVSSKGYNFWGEYAGGLSTNYVYSYNNNSKISFIVPDFASDMKLAAWEFYSPSIYDMVKRDLVNDRYRLVTRESRLKGKYESLFYSKPGIDIILTVDKTVGRFGSYTVAVRQTNMNKYQTVNTFSDSNIYGNSNPADKDRYVDMSRYLYR